MTAGPAPRRRSGSDVLTESRSYHPVALAGSAVLTALLGLAVHASGGGWPEARMAGLLAYNLLSIIAGMLLVITWRIGGQVTIGWLSVVVLGVSLSEMPFMMMGFVASPPRAVPGGEVQEVVAVALVMVLVLCARRGRTPGALSPLTLAVGVGVLLALLRAALYRWGPDSFEAASGWGLAQRGVLAVLIAVTLAALWRTTDLPRKVRVAYLIVLASTSLFAFNDTGVDWLGPPFGAVVTVFYLIWLAELQLEVAIGSTVRVLVRRQQEQTDLAVRTAAAQELVARDAAVLDAVRGRLAPLVRASSALEHDQALAPGERAALARALQAEIDQINSTLAARRTQPADGP